MTTAALGLVAIATLITLSPAFEARAQPTVSREPPNTVLRSRMGTDTGASAAIRAQAVPVTTIDRATMLRTLGGSAGKIKVSRTSGLTEAMRTTGDATLSTGDFYFSRLSDTAKVVMKSNITVPGGPDIVAAPEAAITTRATTYAIPYRWLTVDSAQVQRLLVPYFILRGGGLTYDIVRRVYKGMALVGVEDTLHPGEPSAQLPRPLQLMVETRSGGTVSPRNLNISHTSLEYDSVIIESPDSTSILMRTGEDRVGITIAVPVRAIVASMIPDQLSIQGFGLATTEITVSLPRGIPRSDTAVLSFRSTGAPAKPARLRLAGGDAGTLKLRSGLPGADTIRAYLDGVPVAETVIVIKRPWPFLQATFLGVLLGGALRWAAKRRKSLRSLGGEILRGLPFGALAAAALSVGLTLLPVNVEDPSAWVGVMVTAALGAWFGSPLLKKAIPDTA